ncbi:hypothetical protein [Franzmannia qiaohouensis]|uniref:Uncharacterized protein n=1 Tax=Franzmannia qiaohouensis TaxID=1329370 RepID=A0ABU1HL55_9GAMM|nr:hypothetical protein [Halomonas qiaohouensis]MDR5907499.1 hypothetical protein [Halomonas qiaohouensis]
MISSFLKHVWIRLPSVKGFFYKPRKKTYLFLPINGAGLGHLTRSLAIARKLRREQPDADIVFLTTSIGVTLVHKEGFQCHHITPSKLLKADAITWNKLFYRSLVNVLGIHRPHCLVFDGTIPYLGLRRAMRGYPKLQCIWIKRGLYKEGIDQTNLKSLTLGFSSVVAPGELVSEDEDAVTPDLSIHQVEPISLLDGSDLMKRDLARDILRLPKDQPCAYVQLGAGNINGIEDVQDKIINSLKEKGIRVVLGQSPIALNPQANLSADSVIVDYPNSKYFRAFDFAVLAGGYNSVCEAVTLELPALFIPNTETGADDQLKRVQQSRHYGPYEVMVEYSEEFFDAAIGRLLKIESRGHGSGVTNGAVSAAELIARHGV